MIKMFCTICIIFYNVTIANKLVFVNSQTFKSNRSACVRFICRNSNFCTETISKTICKSC